MSFLPWSKEKQQDKWLSAECGLDFSVRQHLQVSFEMGIEETRGSPSQAIAKTFCKPLGLKKLRTSELGRGFQMGLGTV